MKTNQFSSITCCVVPVALLAVFAVLMPFILVADVLGANLFSTSIFLKIGIVAIMFIAFQIMRQHIRIANK